MNKIEKDFEEILEEDGMIQVIFQISQELVQDTDQISEESRILNIIVGSSFSLWQAIQRYKEIKNGKSIDYRS